MAISSKPHIAARFAAAVASYDSQAQAQQLIHSDLIALLKQHVPATLTRILEIGCGTATYSQQLAQYFQTASFVLNDLTVAYETHIKQKMPSETEIRFGDAEQIDLGQHYQLITAASAIQWFHDPAAFIKRSATMLQTQGYLLFNSFTADNLHEIRKLTGIGLTYPDNTDWQQWLKPHYHILTQQQRTIVLNFATPLDVLHHLQATGVSAVAPYQWTPQKLKRFSQHYTEQFSNPDGSVRLSYTPLYILAQKNTETQ